MPIGRAGLNRSSWPDAISLEYAASFARSISAWWWPRRRQVERTALLHLRWRQDRIDRGGGELGMAEPLLQHVERDVVDGGVHPEPVEQAVGDPLRSDGQPGLDHVPLDDPPERRQSALPSTLGAWWRSCALSNVSKIVRQPGYESGDSLWRSGASRHFSRLRIAGPSRPRSLTSAGLILTSSGGQHPTKCAVSQSVRSREG